MNAKLPNFFKFKTSNDLIRVGRKFDGGYLVSKKDIIQSEMLISLGICDDWSFEIDFTKINNVDVLAYDGSINLKFWVKRTLIEIIKNPFSFYPIKKFLSYNTFFRGNHKLIKKFVGLNATAPNYCSFGSIFKNIKNKKVFLKIDIEGSEYRIFNELIENQSKICGLVIEVHDCDLHLGSIKSFIKKFKLNLVHIHANNFAPIRSSDQLPTVLELTFSKYAKPSKLAKLPNKIDMPNDKYQEEINLIV